LTNRINPLMHLWPDSQLKDSQTSLDSRFEVNPIPRPGTHHSYGVSIGVLATLGVLILSYLMHKYLWHLGSSSILFKCQWIFRQPIKKNGGSGIVYRWLANSDNERAPRWGLESEGSVFAFNGTKMRWIVCVGINARMRNACQIAKTMAE
jgi:hypothetical protein